MKKLLTAIIACAIVLPIKAADFDIYGRVAPAAWFTKRERFYDDSIGVDTVTGNAIIESDSLPLYYCTLWPFGEFGFKLNSERIGVCTEFGVRQSVYSGYISGATSPKFRTRELWAIYTRHFYLEWYINDWVSLLLGKTEAPACFFPSDQRFYGGNSFRNSGALYTGSNTMIQFSFGNDLTSEEVTPSFSWKAKAAAVKVDTAAVKLYGEDNVKSESKFPKFEGSFEAQFEKDFFTANLELGGGFQQFIMTYKGTQIEYYKSQFKVNSYVLGYDLGLKVGPVSVAYNWAWGQDLGSYGVEISSPFLWRQVNAPGLSDVQTPTLVDIFYPKHFKVVDTTGSGNDYWELRHGKAVQMCAVLSVKPLKWLSFEGGYGYLHAEHEHPALDTTWEDTHAYYGGLRFKIAEILEVNPEFGQYIYGNEPGFGRMTYWGVELAIVF